MQREKNNAVLFSGGDINTYLQSLGTGFGVDSRDVITTVPNAMEEDKEYYVCVNFQEKIIKAVDLRKRRSDQLNPEGTTHTYLDTITRLTAVFEDKNIGV